MALVNGRYVVLGFLDSVLTTLILGEAVSGTVKLIVIVTIINLITAFMAEYIEERASLSRIEKSLLRKRGSLLRTSLHRRAIYDALIKGLIFGVVSLVGASVTEFSMGILEFFGIPIVPLIVLGGFGTLMSKYFRGNAILWFMLYIVLGLTVSLLGHVINGAY
ncbi:MAG: hypothetical protein ACP5GY_01935 [Vulcanisaeta sp.]